MKARAVCFCVAIGATAVWCSQREPGAAADPVAPLAADAPAGCTTTRPSPKLRQPMTVLCDDTYAENGLDERQLAELRVARATAASNIVRAFGKARAAPLVTFCRTEQCKLTFGASPDVAASDDLGFANTQVWLDDDTMAPSAVVVTGPVSGSARILTHELVHAEMKAVTSYDSLPTWFNEGTATYLASEPQCDHVAAGDFDVTRLTTKKKWARHLSDTHAVKSTYCASSHEVEKWLTHFEGAPAKAKALDALLQSVANGTSFDQALASGS